MTNTSWSGDRTAFPPRTRRAILHRDPICVACHSRPSTIADHEPNYAALVRAGVPDPHDIQYGRGMCRPCHDAKTRTEQRAGQARWRLPAEPHPGLTQAKRPRL